MVILGCPGGVRVSSPRDFANLESHCSTVYLMACPITFSGYPEVSDIVLDAI